MLLKFETKSSRVKGLSFHPTMPWILVSLHTGAIQLWDYHMGTLVDTFDEHEGSVRSVDFHATQPLFCSGGDDCRVRVWNYKKRRCLFALFGHMDYVRTVQFHFEQPWIVSASDDQTIRIWNWQNRSSIAVLTGHNHYVMSAFFHPRDYTLVSASLDQTIRIWDISALRTKAPPTSEAGLQLAAINAELFGSSDAVVKCILDGHERGVNWASFHPTNNMIASASDDRTVRLWRVSSKLHGSQNHWSSAVSTNSHGYEVDVLRQHQHVVSCVLFHPKLDIFVSNSEDKTIRVWDMTHRHVFQTIRRDSERFWVLACHPNEKLIAAGHDGGMFIFKLCREKPAYFLAGENVYYVRAKNLRRQNLTNEQDTQLTILRKRTLFSTFPSLSINTPGDFALVTTDSEGGTWELYLIKECAEPLAGFGKQAFFVARNRFVVLERDKLIHVRDLTGQEMRVVGCSKGMIDDIFPATNRQVIAKVDDNVVLIDVSTGKQLAALGCPPVRNVVWSSNCDLVALISKHHITLATKRLEYLCTVYESIRVKSGIFGEGGVFIFSTNNHIKFLLPSRDSGILASIKKPVYLVQMVGKIITYLDRDGFIGKLTVDDTELRFKQSVIAQRNNEIFNFLQQQKLLGESIIGYLQMKDFPEIAMHFAKNPETKFRMALECGALEKAFDIARSLSDSTQAFNQLAELSLVFGDIKTAEQSMLRSKNFEKLSFLYLCTGNVEKVRKMSMIADHEGDQMRKFQNSLYLGDVTERIRALASSGHAHLAYVTAITHSLDELAEEVRSLLLQEKLSSLGITLDEADDEGIDLEALLDLPDESEYIPDGGPQLLFPPTPIFRAGEDAWPMLNVARGFFENVFLEDGKIINVEAAIQNTHAGSSAWDENFSLSLSGSSNAQSSSGWDTNLSLDDGEPSSSTNDGWDDFSIPELRLHAPSASRVAQAGNGEGSIIGSSVAPTVGSSCAQHWVDHSELAPDHVAAGSFRTAMQILQRTAGVVNFEPLRSVFMEIWMGSRLTLPLSCHSDGITVFLLRNADTIKKDLSASLPRITVSQPSLSSRVDKSYVLFAEGKFADALSSFRSIMQSAILAVASSRDEAKELRNIVNICREYVLALMLEIERREKFKDLGTSNSPELAIEVLALAAYFSHSSLLPQHLFLALRSAMTVSFKLKNFIHASIFAKRLMELNPHPSVAEQVQKVIEVSEVQKTNAFEIDYDPRNPFVVCAASLSPIYRGSVAVKCPYCYASCHQKFSGVVCPVCQLSSVGTESSGIRWI